MALGWTVIFSTLEDGVDSFTMMGSHDNKVAWQEALDKLSVRYGPARLTKLYAITKGMNPTYTGDRES
jgi:hypothetical protein